MKRAEFRTTILTCLVCVAGLNAQQTDPNTPAPKGLNIGIKVHGHWVIEVKDPDGRVATHREFENSLVTAPGGGGTVLSGSQALVLLLLGGASVPVGAAPIWVLQLLSTAPDVSPCGAGNSCVLKPAMTTSLPNSAGLGEWIPCSTTVVTNCIPSQFTVSSTVAGSSVTTAGTVDAVSTQIFLSGLTASNQGITAYANFSSASLAPPVQVAAGQSIYAAVTYSFQ